MCTLSVSMDDKVINRVKPLFDGDKAMQKWIEMVLHRALEEYADQFVAQEERNTESARILSRIKEVGEDPNGFYKLGGVLGKPRAGFSWEELREEAICDKYGVHQVRLQSFADLQ